MNMSVSEAQVRLTELFLCVYACFIPLFVIYFSEACCCDIGRQNKNKRVQERMTGEYSKTSVK